MTAAASVVATPAAVGGRACRNEPSAAVRVLLAPAPELMALYFVVPIVRIVWLALSEPIFGLERFADIFASHAGGA